MNIKATRNKNQVVANVFEQKEILKKAEVIKENLKSSTWHELETNGKFGKNEKRSFITEQISFRQIYFRVSAPTSMPLMRRMGFFFLQRSLFIFHTFQWT